MANETLCQKDWGIYSEFLISTECKIYKPLDVGIRIFEIVLSCSIFLIETIILFNRRSSFQSKNSLAKLLLLSTLFINLILIIRPLIGIVTSFRSVNNIGVNIMTNISATLVAEIAILFVLFEVNLLHRGLIKSNNYLYKQRKIYLGSLSVVQIVLYLGGAILPHFIDGNNVSRGFWFATAITDIGAIPYLCISGFIIYMRINKMEKDIYKKLSRRILIMVTLCGMLGSFTFIVSLVLFILNGSYTVEWIFIEFCWIAAVLFCGCIFVILIRRNKNHINNRSTRGTTGTRSTGGSRSSKGSGVEEKTRSAENYDTRGMGVTKGADTTDSTITDKSTK